jgi:hypothetical protein
VIFDPPSRTRRRLWGRLVWPLLAVAAVVVALVVSSAGEETRVELDYLESVQGQSADLARSGDAMRDVVSRLQRIERNELVTVIDGIELDLAAGLDLTEQGPPIGSLIAVNALYREALETWDSGVTGFEASILSAADEPENLGAIDAVADALAEIRAADHAYARMVAAMGRDDVPEPLSPMPEVILMPAEGRLLGLAAAYVDSARSENSGLALRPGLAISQIVPEPEWQVNPEGQAVLPATTTVQFSVVVSNVGNVESDLAPVVLELIGGPEPVRLSDQIDALEPNQQTTIVFDEMALEPGGLYEIRASLVVTGNDVSFEDNEISVEFTVNAEE